MKELPVSSASKRKTKKWIIWWWHCGCEFILRTCALRENLQSTGLMNIINHERALSDWLTGSAGAMLESNWVRVCELEERSLKVSHCWRDRAETCQQGGATPLQTQANRGHNRTTEFPFHPLTVTRNPWYVLHCTVGRPNRWSRPKHHCHWSQYFCVRPVGMLKQIICKHPRVFFIYLFLLINKSNLNLFSTY